MDAAHQPLQSSLFDPVYADDYSSAPERDVAVHLDGHAAVTWWHRNVAKAGYGLQGWRRQKVYPDFIFAAAQDGRPNRIVVLETKGEQLAGNDDTVYKQAIMDVLTGAFEWDRARPAGELELVADDGTTVQCEMVLMQDVVTHLPALIMPNTTKKAAHNSADASD
jgi:type III restriction enzyme